MGLDIPWYRVNRLTDLLHDVTWATEEEALAIAIIISDMILDVSQQALDEAVDHAEGVKNTLNASIDGKISDVMLYIDEQTDLIYDQLEVWLDDVEDWITFLVEDITGSIEENLGMSEENIEGIGTVIGDNIGAGITETGSWIGDVYDNVKTTIWDSTTTLVDRLANLVDMITNAPQIIINKMATELIPAEAGQWLLTAGNVLTGADMGQWFNTFKGIITSAGSELFEFDTEEVMNNFIKSFMLMKEKIPDLLKT